MRALARVDVGGDRAQLRAAGRAAAPAALCAVVKADGYGHGAVAAARAAQAGGATWLAVATAGEAAALRAAGIDGPVLVMGALVAGGARRSRSPRGPTWSPGARASSPRSPAARRRGRRAREARHRDGPARHARPGEADRVAAAVAAAPRLGWPAR